MIIGSILLALQVGVGETQDFVVISPDEAAFSGAQQSGNDQVLRASLHERAPAVVYSTDRGVYAFKTDKTAKRFGIVQSIPETGRAELAILDDSGHMEFTVDNIVSFDWAPTGDRLVIIESDTAVDIDESKTTVSVLTLSNMTTKRVIKGGIRVEWCRFDGNIYIAGSFPDREARVVRYVVATGRCEDTPYHDVFFSPRGSWYCFRRSENHPQVFKTASNEQIMPDCTEFFSPYGALRWLSDDLISMTSGVFGKNYIFDCVSRRAWKIQGIAVAASDVGRTIHILTPERRLIAVPLTDLPIVAGPGAPPVPDSDKK